MSFEDFGRYVAEHGIADEDLPEAFARWLSDRKSEPVRFEKVEPGDEQILPGREQRELDSLPSALDREERRGVGPGARAAAVGPL